jgi:tubulin-specific chaperone A
LQIHSSLFLPQRKTKKRSTRTHTRLIKEANYYKEETKENEAKIAKMKEENKDKYDIKKFQEVLDESIMMIPDSENRMKKAAEDLEVFIANNSTLESEEWLGKAKALLEESCA